MEYQYSHLIQGEDWSLLAIVPSTPITPSIPPSPATPSITRTSFSTSPSYSSSLPVSLSSNNYTNNVSLSSNKSIPPKYFSTRY